MTMASFGVIWLVVMGIFQQWLLMPVALLPFGLAYFIAKED
jgi:hypothetical protein